MNNKWNRNNLIKSIAIDIINSFPRTKSWNNYLTIKSCNKKLFFNVFIKKYWLDWKVVKYLDKDISRRMRLVEFLDYITNSFRLTEEFNNKWNKTYVLRTKFHKLIIIEVWKNRYELLSLYNHI